MTSIARNLIIAGCLLLLLPSAAAARKAGDIIPGRFIVTFEEGVDPRSFAHALRRAHGFRLKHVFRRGLRGMAIELPAGSELPILDALRFDRRVRSIGNDRYVTALQTVPKGVDRINAEPFVGANTGAPASTSPSSIPGSTSAIPIWPATSTSAAASIASSRPVARPAPWPTPKARTTQATVPSWAGSSRPTETSWGSLPTPPS